LVTERRRLAVPDDAYEKGRNQDERVLREWDLASLRKMIAGMPAAQRREAKLVIGDRTLTVDEMLKEAEKGTEIGKVILRTQTKLRLEQLRRG
jgi:hypothetical protein